MTQPKIIIAEDEPELAKLYERYLPDQYQVHRTRYGQETLDLMDEDVDVVLLDRRLPDLSGTEVLTQIREHNEHCRVAIITSVQPDVDIIEMGFDEYLCKPVRSAELQAVVERLIRRATFTKCQRVFFASARKYALLKERLDSIESTDGDGVAALEDKIVELRQNTKHKANDLDGADFEVFFRQMEDGDG